MNEAVAIAAIACAGMSSALAGPAITAELAARRRRLKVESRLAPNPAGGGVDLVLNIIASALFRQKPVRDLAGRFKPVGARDFEKRFTAVVLASPVAVLLIFIITSSLPVALEVSAVALVGYDMWLKRIAQQRLEVFARQIPELFKSIAGALGAGSSLSQALVYAADQADEPARSELRAVTEEISLGLPFDRALSNLYERMPVVELRMINMCLSIQRKIGGDLVKLLRDITKTIEERRRLRKNLDVETSQARFSARVIGMLPVIITVAISLLDPSFMAPLFVTPIGLTMLSVAITAEVVGFLWLRRILDIKI